MDYNGEEYPHPWHVTGHWLAREIEEIEAEAQRMWERWGAQQPEGK